MQPTPPPEKIHRESLIGRRNRARLIRRSHLDLKEEQESSLSPASLRCKVIFVQPRNLFMTKKKKTVHRRKSSSKKSSLKARDPLSKSALLMIDKASLLLKRSVVESSKQTAKARHAMKKRAYSLLNVATRHLNSAIGQGSKALRKSLSKL